MVRVFLSHASRDSAAAVGLRRWLAEQNPGLGGEIYLDLDPGVGIQAGVRWKEALRQASARCEAVICLLSRHWVESRECGVEYRTAENLGKRIFVVRLEPLDSRDITGEWQRCDLFGDGPVTSLTVDGYPEPVRFRTAGLRQLLTGLAAAGIGAEHFPWPPPEEPDRSPYRGWQPFEPVDAAVYFGRDRQIVQAMDALRGIRATGLGSLFVVLGPSGTGKSSFLRAGLLPRLLRDDRTFLVLDVVRPEHHALTGSQGFADALHRTRLRLGLTSPTRGEIKAVLPDAVSIRELLAETLRAARSRRLDPEPNAIAANITESDATELDVTETAPGRTATDANVINPDTLDPDTTAPTIVLPIDQAEELLVADAGVQGEQFLALLGELLSHANAGTEAPVQQQFSLIVVLTIRTDRYALLQTTPQLNNVRRHIFDALEPMPRTQFQQVITGPAARAEAGLRIEPELVERLLADSDQGADTLPLLALTLSRLYDDYGSSGTLTAEQYVAMGGIEHVVDSEIDTILATDPERRRIELEQLRTAFIPALATVDPDTDQPIRRIARWDELPAGAHRLIDGFIDKRLLVKDFRDGQTVVEVALESLLRQWDQLAAWLREQADNLATVDRLERAVADWNRHGRDEAWLLEGTRLTDAETVAATSEYQRRLAPARDYLAASRRRETDRMARLRNRARALTALLIVAVLVAGLAALGFWQATTSGNRAERLAHETVAERLITEGLAMLNTTRRDTDIRAIHQILAAHALAPSPRTEGAIIEALNIRPHLITVIETGTVHEVALSPDGLRIAAGLDDGTVRVWDAETGRSTAEFDGHAGQVRSIAFSPDGHRIVAGTSNGTVWLWDVATDRFTALDGRGEQVSIVAFSPDGQLIAVGGAHATVHVWDGRTGRRIVELVGQESAVAGVAWSPDGSRIVTGDLQGAARVWEVATARQIATLSAPGEFFTVLSVAWSADGRRIAASGSYGVIRVWDADTGTLIAAPERATPPPSVASVAFSPDGHRIVTGDSEGTVRVWDAGTGGVIATLQGHHGGVESVRFSADGRRIGSGGGSTDGTVRVWHADVARLTALVEGDVATLSGTSAVDPWTVALSPDGRRVAAGETSGRVRLADTATGRLIATLAGHRNYVSMVFSDDGRRIATYGGDGQIRIWDTETGEQLAEFPAATVTSLAWRADGRRIAVGDSVGRVLVWDVGSGKQVALLGKHENQVESVAFSPDGRRIASGDYDGTVQVWDAETGHRTATLTGHTAWVTTLAFSPDGHRIVSGGYDRVPRVWDAESGRRTAVLEGHTGSIRSLSFSPDGRRIVSGGYDGTVRVWATETGRQTATLGSRSTAHSALWTTDGLRIVSINQRWVARHWDAVPDAAQLCAKLTTDIGPNRWNAWVSPDIPHRELCPELPAPPA